MTQHAAQFIALHGQKSSLILDVGYDTPQIIYWRTKLSEQSTGEMMRALRLRQEAPVSPIVELDLCITPTSGQGFTGLPGLSLHGDTDQWAANPKLKTVTQSNEHSVTLTNVDAARGVEVVVTIKLDAETDVLTFDTVLNNITEQSITLDWCAAATVPTPADFDQIIGFEGHWAGEFQQHSLDQFFGSYVRENRRGKTSHDSYPALLLHPKTTNQAQGEAYGFHLGWSGNHKIVAEKMADGRSYVQMGELLFPGEIVLEKDQSYQTPTLFASYTDQGLSVLSQQFHQYVRTHIIRQSVHDKPRPVHYNTWEGIYFNHDVETLKDLAERAAEMGAERFVLDDGWFNGRNDDTAGLGDWYVDKAFYPQGLTPVIDHVKAQGLEFGLWFEPEMVNPDSELYRQHPEWVLGNEVSKQIDCRNQLVLDLSRPEVFDYLFERLDSLLTEYDISYVKWDMNRDLNHQGNHSGKPGGHNQIHAVYRLLDKIRETHPQVEVESCASGGGRADYGVLARTDRVWTSDSNDALERLKIQNGFSYFLPSELMGSHVGPRECHITHRTVSMEMRASVTLFGHMGMEMDLRELTDAEKVELKAMTDLYKQHRALVHSGDLFRLELPAYMNGLGIVARDKTQALFSYSLIACSSATLPDQYKFAGLEKNSQYKLDIIWPIKNTDKWPKSGLFGFANHLGAVDGHVFSGELLMQLGMQMPLLTPQSSLLFHLTKV
ncbi:MAG: alpha-galactosidase [Paraglaciecola chathamensis]